MCCHCIIKTLLLLQLDLAKWLRNDRWKWITTDRENKTLEIVHSHSLEVQSPHPDEEDLKCSLSLLYVPVTQAASERKTPKHPRSTFQILTYRNMFNILIFFMTTVAF